MRLTAKYPLPWRIEQDEGVDPDKYIGGFTVFCANGQVVMSGGTYSGDGDGELNLDRLQAAELVQIVNRQLMD